MLDFEFISESGAHPIPVCMVARELISNRLVRMWQDKLSADPPFSLDERTLFVAFYAPAEWGCFAALGWPMPARVIDLYAEFRAKTNGIPLPTGRGLLSALSSAMASGRSLPTRNIQCATWCAADRGRTTSADRYSTTARQTLTASGRCSRP